MLQKLPLIKWTDCEDLADPGQYLLAYIIESTWFEWKEVLFFCFLKLCLNINPAVYAWCSVILSLSWVKCPVFVLILFSIVYHYLLQVTTIYHFNYTVQRWLLHS